MKAQSKQTRMGLFEAKCRARGLPLTVQRRVILDALLDRTDHPNVDQLFDDVRGRIPGVSRATVYRALETLVQLGVARKTHHSSASVRFDGNVDHHHHLVCVKCGEVADLDDRLLNKLRLPDVSRTGFRIVDFSVLLEGFCRKCRKVEGVSG